MIRVYSYSLRKCSMFIYLFYMVQKVAARTTLRVGFLEKAHKNLTDKVKVIIPYKNL